MNDAFTHINGPERPDETAQRSRPALWIGLFAALATARLLLPFLPWDPSAVHAAVAGSAAAGQAWGRQGLIGSQEFPMLPTLALLFAQSVLGLTPETACRAATAVAQAWTLCYLLRLTPRMSRRFLALLLLAPAVLPAPPLRPAVMAADAAWIAAVPMAAGIFHAEKWRSHQDIRDLVLTAANAALLVFAGPVGIAAAVGLAGAVGWALHRLPSEKRRGNVFLLWTPLVYAFSVLLLLNWLILADPFFSVRPIIQRIGFGGGLPPRRLGDLFFAFLPAPLIGACLVIVLFRTLHRRAPNPPGTGAAAAAACAATVLLILSAKGVFASSGLPLVATGTAGAVVLAVGTLPTLYAAPVPAALVVWGVTAACGALQPASMPPGAVFFRNMPKRDELLRAVDRHWPEARILLFGMRIPSRYPDPVSRRFLPRLDLHVDDVLNRARSEVLYLLTPPPETDFPDIDPAFADLARHGRPWLFLEHRWPSGWRLWRVALQPDRMSPIEKILKEGKGSAAQIE